MPVVAPARRTATRMVALVATALALGVTTSTLTPAPVGAVAPNRAGAALVALATPDTDDEGGTPALRAQLDAASKGYLDAKTALNRSTKRQQQLTGQLKTIEGELAVRSAKVGQIAASAYRISRLSTVSALLGANSPEGFLDRAASLNAVAANEDRELRDLLDTRDQATQARTALDQEVREQRKQVEVMGKRKQQAEQALKLAGSGAPSTGVSGSSGAASATAAPRNSDGSWPSESCSANDPTTSGCITPRTLHALKQAKAAGYTRYVSCYRSGGSGEHPKGRACDFAAQKGGFGGVATGGDRTYGNNLAAYFVRNADRLGVLYVIWYRQIWLPSSGWKSYSGGNGDPSSDHTNHVHLSMY